MTVVERCVTGETPVLRKPDDKLLTRRYAFVPQNTSPKEAEMRGILALCAVALLTVSAMAQDKPAAKAAKTATPKTQPAMGGMPPMPKPSPEFQKLAKVLVGTWNTAEKFESMMGMPAAEGKGKAVITRGPGGMSLIETYNSASTMGKFSGHGVFWWDDKAKSFAGVWCDTMTPHGCDSGGTSKFEGDDLVGTMEMEMYGKKMKMKNTYTNIKPDSFTFNMETSTDGGPMQKSGTIEYTRAAAPAAEKK